MPRGLPCSSGGGSTSFSFPAHPHAPQLLVVLLMVSFRGILQSMAELADATDVVEGFRPVFIDSPALTPQAPPTVTTYVTAADLSSFKVHRSPHPPWTRRFPRLRGALSALDGGGVSAKSAKAMLSPLDDNNDDDVGAGQPSRWSVISRSRPRPSPLVIHLDSLPLAAPSTKPKPRKTTADRVIDVLSRVVLAPAPLLSLMSDSTDTGSARAHSGTAAAHPVATSASFTAGFTDV